MGVGHAKLGWCGSEGPLKQTEAAFPTVLRILGTESFFHLPPFIFPSSSFNQLPSQVGRKRWERRKAIHPECMQVGVYGCLLRGRETYTACLLPQHEIWMQVAGELTQ